VPCQPSPRKRAAARGVGSVGSGRALPTILSSRRLAWPAEITQVGEARRLRPAVGSERWECWGLTSPVRPQVAAT
jgi:hypothetical protein